MVTLTQTERFFAAHCAMLFATFLCAVVVGFGLLWLARRRKDPARWSFIFVKFAAIFFLLYCFTEFCADAVWIVFSRFMGDTRDGNYDDYAVLATLLQARVELAAAARFTDCILVIFIFLTIVILGAGVNIVRTGEQGRHDMIIKRTSYVFAGLLGALAAIEWALRIKVYIEFYTDDYDFVGQDAHTLKLLNVSRQLDFAFVVIAWSLAIAVFARSTQIWLPSRRDKRLDFPLLYLMLCSGAWLFRATYELIYQLKFVNINDIRHNPKEPAYIELIEIVFHTWSIFAVIVMMLALGAKKQGGLWSTEQSFSVASEDASQDIPLEPMNASPPAYSASPGSLHSPHIAPPPPAVTTSASQSPNTRTPQGQPWQQTPTAEQDDLGDHERLVEGLGLGAPSRYQPPTANDNAYNTGIVPPTSPTQAGPASEYDIGPIDGYGMGMGMPPRSPPAHDEAMGLNHQADGRPPVQEPLPYPEKN